MALISLTGAILAGGKGQRVSNQDKGLLLFDESPMVLSVYLALRDVVDCVFVNANRNIEQYCNLDFEVVSDMEIYCGKGPLSGLFTCLNHANSSHLLISPCDTPRISSAAFFSLKCASVKNPDQIHYLVNGSDHHPLHAILPVNAALIRLEDFLSQKKRCSVMAFYEFFGCNPISWEEQEELLNVNTFDCLSSPKKD